MSNAGFQLFNELFPVGANVLYAACLALFVKSFMPGQICPYRKLLVIFSAFMTISLLCNAITAPQGLTGLLMTFLLIGRNTRTGKNDGLSVNDLILELQSLRRFNDRQPVLYPGTIISSSG